MRVPSVAHSTSTATTAPSIASSVPLTTCAVAPVPELVGDDELDLRSARRREQRVVEHDAPRPAEPRHVRIHLRRAAARVGDEHVADRHAGALGERAQLGRELLVLERPEAVEERLEHDGRDER